MKKRLLFFLLLLGTVCLLASCISVEPPVPEKYTVTYYYNGVFYKEITYKTGEEPVLPTKIDTYPDDEIDGWYSDFECTKRYAGEKRAYAKTALDTYTLTLDPNGGTCTGDSVITFTKNTSTFMPKNPTRPGYNFIGWLDEEGVHHDTYSVTRGTQENIKLKAEWEIVTYTITYELDGGAFALSDIVPDHYTVEDTFLLPIPLKAMRTFLGWQIGGSFVRLYTVEKGTTGNLTFTAKFSDGNPVFTYQSATEGMTVSASVPAGNVEIGTEITLLAEGMKNGYRFSEWRFGTHTVSTSPSYTFTVDKKQDVNAYAIYEPVRTVTYDKSSGGNLKVSLSQSTATPTGVFGASIVNGTETGLSKGQIVIAESALKTLSLGEYSVAVTTNKETEYFTLKIVSTAGPSDLAVVYDTDSFPSVEIRFNCDCGGKHTYRIDGGSAVNCKSGDTMTTYTKSADHTVTVTCENGNSASVSRKGYTAANMEYYTTFFTYEGHKYDYVIGSEEEFYTFCEYIVLVAGVLDYQDDGNTDKFYQYYVDESMFPVFDNSDKAKVLFDNAFTKTSFPMSPQYLTKTFGGAVREISVRYPSGINSEPSHQPKTYLTDDRGIFSKTGRAESFNAFPIDACETTVEIRTLYELENLTFGAKPTFAATAADAQTVYEKARAVLRTITDDSMNDYQKASAIYTYLAMNVTYDDWALEQTTVSSYRSFTTYGALIDGVAVCDGFASAYRLLCQIEGIEVNEICGLKTLGDKSSGHAWCVLFIDGLTYGVDPTWGRRSEELFTMYYAFMDEETLQKVGHYENAWVDNRSTENAADGFAMWYQMNGTMNGSDYEITSSEEFIATLKSALNAELKTVEVLITDGKADQYINDATYALHRSIGYMVLPTLGIYFIDLS